MTEKAPWRFFSGCLLPAAACCLLLLPLVFGGDAEREEEAKQAMEGGTGDKVRAMASSLSVLLKSERGEAMDEEGHRQDASKREAYLPPHGPELGYLSIH
jgi:hypothetical protein